VAARLHRAGAELAGCDPAVPPGTELGAIEVVGDAYAAAADADAIVVLTEWAQFRMLDWMKVAKVMRTPVVVDTRNLLDRGEIRRSGLVYTSIGRGLGARSEKPGQRMTGRRAAPLPGDAAAVRVGRNGSWGRSN